MSHHTFSGTKCSPIEFAKRARSYVRSLPIACLSLIALAFSASPAAAQVKISQVYGSGGGTAAPNTHDYIEIYNTGAPQALTGWSVQYTASTGTTWTVTALPAVVLGTGQYLLVRESAGGIVVVGQAPELPLTASDVSTGTIVMDPTNFKVALVSSTVALVGGVPTYTGNPTLVDFIGVGTANWNDSAAAGGANLAANNAPPVSVAHALYRRLCGALDTNNNRNDCAVGWPAPRNFATAVNNGITAIGSALPLSAEETQSVRLTCTPYRCATGDLGVGTVVTVDTTLIGGGAAVPMLDGGVAPDEVANDGIYTALVPIAAATTPGTKALPVSVSDGGGNSGATYISILVTATTAPNNDNCSTAIALATPSTTVGSLTGATVETNAFVTTAGVFTTGMGARRGVWYTVTGTGTTLTASLCGTTPVLDSVMMLMCGTCDGLTVIAVDDDFCGSLNASQISWCSQAGTTYYIWLAPFATGASTASFTLNITDNGLSCGTAFPCPTCVGSSGPFAEKEPGYGAHTNDGCASTPNLFTDIPTPVLAPTNYRGTARGMTGNRDVDVYRFQAATNEIITVSIDTLGTNAQAQLQLLSAGGTCPATGIGNTPLFVARCVSGIQTVTSAVIAGQWYAVQVVGGIGIQVSPAATVFGGQMPGGTTYQYDFDVSIGGTPPNDLCANAVALTLGGAYVYGSTTSASNDGTSTCDPTGNDIWYQVTTTAPGTLTVDTCGSTNDTVLTVYATCGGAPIACNDDCGGSPCGATSSCLSIPGLGAGNYKIRVSDKGVGGTIRIRAASVLGNDTCAVAQLVTIPSSNPGTTIGATAEVPAPPACAGPLPGGSQSFTYTNGVWYRLISPINQTVTVDTLASAYDSKIWVFDATGGCGALTCVTANDDIQGTPFNSKASWVATAGVEYRIMVGPFTTTTGNFTLTVSGAPTPTNDQCGSATVISGSNGSIGGTTVGATALNNTSTAANPSCNPSYSMFDVYYSYTAPCSTNFTIRTCGSYDTILSVHTACPTATLSNQLGTTCNDQGPVGCTPGSSVTVALTGGITYLVRVAGAVGAAAGNTFTLTWSAEDTDGDGFDNCLDGCPLDPFKTAPGACGCGIADTDTDGDLTPDCNDGCPMDPLKIVPGACGCGIADTDTDGDSTPDCNDGCPMDPLKIAPGACGCGIADTDTDGDMTADCNDGCPMDPLKIAPGQCGCGIADVDTDGDMTANCIDGCPNDPNKIAPGQCGCGFLDTDTDGDATADCNDGCPNDPLKIAPGVCGCGIADTDTDGDATADCNDGCPNDPLKIAPGACGCGVADVDTDADTILDCNDNCPTVANLSQQDSDGDLVGNACDNCPRIPNANQADCNGNSVGDACEIAAGTPDCNANGVPDACDISSSTSADANLNGIPDECEVNGGTPFCFGYGTPTSCPCANNSTPGSGQGCLNSSGSGGKLAGAGLTQVSADGLVLTATNMTGGTCVFLQGDALTNLPFGDGLRCAHGTLKRLATKPVVSQSASYPQGADIPISVKGLVPPTGGVRYYQVFYRNPTGSPCGTLFNITAGISVVWQP